MLGVPTELAALDTAIAALSEHGGGGEAATIIQATTIIERVVDELREEEHERRQEDRGTGVFADPETADQLATWANQLVTAKWRLAEHTCPPTPPAAAPSAGVGVDTSPKVVDKVVEHVRRWMGPIGRDIGAAHVATLQGAILDGLIEARKTLSLQHPAAPSVPPAVEGGLPELPAPDLIGYRDSVARCVFFASYADTSDMGRWYTSDQMRAYGEQCRLAASGQGVRS